MIYSLYKCKYELCLKCLNLCWLFNGEFFFSIKYLNITLLVWGLYFMILFIFYQRVWLLLNIENKPVMIRNDQTKEFSINIHAYVKWSGTKKWQPLKSFKKIKIENWWYLRLKFIISINESLRTCSIFLCGNRLKAPRQ